ncbi:MULTISPECIES: hypothetical protein [unclassified Pseudomonas]|uniref:hypothetical protein n=1 Tax=unclassified Pseudomonas TaxID=196821 RepID=UPI000838E4A7|nr:MULTISPECIES: hypothetical protein [unclassified Pseudomonas]QIH07946.1 hypothetical protein ATY02_15125 [Pseudomonas sp. BIOMIG1BAC]
MKPRSLFALMLFVAPSLYAAPMQWGDIRDGSLYLQAAAADTLHLRWSPAWQSDANHEQLYLLAPDGQLLQALDIPASQAYGQQDIHLPAAQGDYRLQVPGYSFRNFKIGHDSATQAQFEPAKVHFSADVAEGAELYFQVAAGERAVLAGKYHGGVSVLQAVRLSDGLQVRLKLERHEQYPQFDQVPLPPASQDEVWRLSMGGSGKVGFWLDGTANLFAQDLHQLHPLQWTPGQVELTLKPQARGPSPHLGIALPYAQPPQSTFELLRALGARSANFYSFVDVIKSEPLREIGFRRLYREMFAIDHDITLLAGTGRRPVLEADRQTLAGLDAWLADSAQLGNRGTHYLAFADEPNLNYPSYAAFAAYFGQMLEHTRANPDTRAAGVRIAMPASSRLLDGPFRVGAGQRRGIDWAQRLLQEHGEDIDALAWHEWMVRDLLATRRYRDSVRAAAQLVGLDEHGRPRKALLLSQTNISSGPDLSPYQQDTHYAALWWMSVVVNASQDGLLDMLNWFQAADEPEYPKGMLALRDAQRFALKPVAKAQQFIQQHWLGEVQALDNPAFEVDALALRDGARHSLLGVAKTPRPHTIELAATTDLCQSGPRLELLGPDGYSHEAPVQCHAGRAVFQLPGETLFALTWKTL